MSLNIPQFSRFVVGPTLEFLGLDSLAARRLVIGTALAESGGHFLDQVVGPNDRTLGPAYGLYQIEAATYRDLFVNFLSGSRRMPLALSLIELRAREPDELNQLVTNLAYATGVCRMIYFRQPEPLPHADNFAGIAGYWKKYYNTSAGAGTVAGFMTKAEAVMRISMEEVT
jgi:hypothetical protein